MKKYLSYFGLCALLGVLYFLFYLALMDIEISFGEKLPQCAERIITFFQTGKGYFGVLIILSIIFELIALKFLKMYYKTKNDRVINTILCVISGTSVSVMFSLITGVILAFWMIYDFSLQDILH